MRHVAKGSNKDVEVKIHTLKKVTLNYLGITIHKETNISFHHIISKLCDFQVKYIGVCMYINKYI